LLIQHADCNHIPYLEEEALNDHRIFVICDSFMIFKIGKPISDVLVECVQYHDYDNMDNNGY